MRRAGKFAAIATGGLLLFCGVLYLVRCPVAAWLLERYLGEHSIESSVAIERLDFGGAAAQFRLGSPVAPDLTVQRLAVVFDWRDFSPHIASVDLYRPVLRAHFDGHTLSFGKLQNLIGSAPARPAPLRVKSTRSPQRPSTARPAPDAGPQITVQDARLQVATPAGTLKISGSGEFSKGRVRRLTASAEPVTLKGHGIAGNIRRAVLSADSNDRLHIALAGELAIANGAKPTALSGATTTMEISGLRWNANSDGGLHIGARLRASLQAAQFDTGGVSVHALQTNLQAAGDFDTNGVADITAAMTANGTMPAADAQAEAARIPVLGSDPVNRRALAAALHRFSLRADGIHLLRNAGQSYVTLTEPVVISGNGATLQLSAAQGPLVHVAAGVLRGAGELRLEGTRLPNVALTVSSYAWQNTGDGSTFGANANIQAEFSLAAARNASISANGIMAWRNSRFTFALDRCADIAVKIMTIKKQRIANNAALRLCSRQPGEALLSAEPGRWSVHAAWQSLSARFTRANVKLASPQGTIELSQAGGAIEGFVTLARARLNDLARIRRFAPVVASGRVALMAGALRGKFYLIGARTKALGAVTIAGSTKTGRGKAEIHVSNLSFDPGGLQPNDLSPMLAPLSRVKGTASFVGNFAWTPRGLTSGGMLTVHNLDFVGPPGAMHDANGRVRFTSLAPLRTAPNQTISVAKIDWVTPLTNLSATFQLGPERLAIQGAEANLARGQVRLGPLTLSLSQGIGTQGELRLHAIDIGALIAASNLSDKIKASGQVSGTVPFRYGPEGLRLVDGHIATIGPGRLSIAPGTWSDEQAAGGPGAVRGFAYQALEHLAIDKLEGTVNSLPNGRLQLQLHIQGYYDPEKPRAAEVGLFALLQGKAFDKAVPLPKGTKVDLTLDISLNFAELLAEYRKAWAESLTGNPGGP